MEADQSLRRLSLSDEQVADLSAKTLTTDQGVVGLVGPNCQPVEQHSIEVYGGAIEKLPGEFIQAVTVRTRQELAAKGVEITDLLVDTVAREIIEKIASCLWVEFKANLAGSGKFITPTSIQQGQTWYLQVDDQSANFREIELGHMSAVDACDSLEKALNSLRGEFKKSIEQRGAAEDTNVFGPLIEKACQATLVDVLKGDPQRFNQAMARLREYTTRMDRLDLSLENLKAADQANLDVLRRRQNAISVIVSLLFISMLSIIYKDEIISVTNQTVGVDRIFSDYNGGKIGEKFERPPTKKKAPKKKKVKSSSHKSRSKSGKAQN